MDLQVLANLGEFLGGIGVVISLIYLAFQVRGNTRSQRNEIVERSLERLGSMQREMATNIYLGNMTSVALTDIYRLDIQDRIRFSWWCTEFLSAFEFLHDQHLQGNLPTEIWQRWEETYKWWLTFPGMQEWWRCKPTPFTRTFTEFTESMAAAGYEYENPRAWMEFIGQNSTTEQTSTE
jgi:hypothetical protein